MKTIIITALFTLLFLAASTKAQSGGTFIIEQSVIASGGGQQSNGGTFSLDGTTGQSLAGNALSGSSYTVTSGFWNFSPLSPTAADVSVGGRVSTADGRGIRNVHIILTAPNGETRSLLTTPFGYYRFNNLAVGDTYIITVSAKRFTFSQPIIAVSVFQEINDLDFISNF